MISNKKCLRSGFPAPFSGLLICLWIVVGCGGQPPSNMETKNKIVVATDATLIPMAFNNDRGVLSGFEPDLMNAIAKEAQLDIELINVEWAGLFGGLLTQKFDAVISSVTILEERKQKMAFTIPYLRSGVAMVVRKDTEGVNSLADAKAKNLILAAQIGTTAYFLLEKDSEIKKKGYQQYGHAISDLIKGEVGGVLGESTSTIYYKANKTELFQKIKMTGEIMTEEFYGIVLRKEDTELLKTINVALKNLLTNGMVEQLHDKWELGNAASVPKQGTGDESIKTLEDQSRETGD